MKIIKDEVKYGKNGQRYNLVPSNLTADNKLALIEFKLMVVLCGASEKKYTPTIISLAKQFDVSSNTIDRAMKNLKTYGYIHTTGCRKGTVLHVHPIPLEQSLIEKFSGKNYKVIDPLNGVTY